MLRDDGEVQGTLRALWGIGPWNRELDPGFLDPHLTL